MKREIKFRGKRLNNGDWVCGDLHLNTLYPHIHFGFDDRAKIDTNTIGQFTGLLDKNGKEIYEGDIVSFTADKESKNWVRPIKWLGAGFTFGDIFPLNYPSGCYEIVGNIHDNPELLSTNH